MMALDGDGSTQDDAAALAWFEGAAKAARAGLALLSQESESIHADERARVQETDRCYALLNQLKNDADENVVELGGVRPGMYRNA